MAARKTVPLRRPVIFTGPMSLRWPSSPRPSAERSPPVDAGGVQDEQRPSLPRSRGRARGNALTTGSVFRRRVVEERAALSPTFLRAACVLPTRVGQEPSADRRLGARTPGRDPSPLRVYRPTEGHRHTCRLTDALAARRGMKKGAPASGNGPLRFSPECGHRIGGTPFPLEGCPYAPS